MIISRSDHIIQSISVLLSVVSTICWILAQLPQQFQNYKAKSIEGISVEFIVLWFLGDITSVLGCYLTNQLAFQMYLSCYFLFNDCVLLYQFVHYSNYQNSLHIVRSSELTNNSPIFKIKYNFNKLLTYLVTFVSSITASNALPTPSSSSNPIIILEKSSSTLSKPSIGTVIAWCCTFIYLSSRVPQLIKNRKRKSVNGISPLLFMFAFIGNFTYSLSIICSLFMIDPNEYNEIGENLRRRFLIIELPYILGSSGTLLFDGFYFYQRWLYGVKEHKYIVVDDD